MLEKVDFSSCGPFSEVLRVSVSLPLAGCPVSDNPPLRNLSNAEFESKNLFSGPGGALKF